MPRLASLEAKVNRLGRGEGTIPDTVRNNDQCDDATADLHIGNRQVMRLEAEADGNVLHRGIAANVAAVRVGRDQVTDLLVQADVSLDVPGAAEILGRASRDRSVVDVGEARRGGDRHDFSCARKPWFRVGLRDCDDYADALVQT